MSDENVRAGVGHHVYAAHTDLREHGVLLLHEEMDDPEENDGIDRRYVDRNIFNKKKKHIAYTPVNKPWLIIIIIRPHELKKVKKKKNETRQL